MLLGSITQSFNWGKTVVIFLVAMTGFTIGYYRGSSSVYKEWEESRNQIQVKTQELVQKYNEVLVQYQAEQRRLNKLVKDSEINYEKDLATLRGSFTDQLRKSNERINYYRHQIQHSKLSCNRAGDLLSRFDTNLTEGINVVEELTRTLRFRDETINQLRDQLKNVNRLQQPL